MSETKSGSTGSLISDFVGAIKSGMEKVNKYKTNCNAFKQEVSGYATDLKALIDQLEACIGEIEKLQGQYVAFIQQLQIIEENLRIQIRNAASGAKSGADTECNEKILQIKNEFQGLMGLINGLKLDTETGMRTQLGRLKSTLKKLCDETDGIVGKMRKGNTNMKTQVDSMNEEFGVVSTSGMGETKKVEEKSDAEEDLTDLAQYAYRDENDRNRVKLISDLHEDNNGQVMVDNPDYRAVNGRNKDWRVVWTEVSGNPSGRPYYYKTNGENFKENGQDVESTYTHPSKIMAGGMRKTRKKRKTKKKRRKMKGGWQTKSQMQSRNSPIRSLTSVTNSTRKSKSKRSMSKKSKSRKSKSRRNSIKKSRSRRKSRRSIRKTY